MTAFLTKYFLPLACIGVSAWLIFDGQAQVAKAQENRASAQQELTVAQDAHLALDRLGDSKPVLSEPESAAEEARFLSGLRRHAALQGAAILKWSSTTEVYKEDAKMPEHKALVGLTRVTSHLSAVGSYASLYKFLQSISSSQRLYTFSDIRWTRDSAANRLTFSLTRYVEPASQTSSQ